MQSSRSNVLLAKIWGPFLCLVIAICITGRNLFSRDFFLGFPFLIAAFFGFSIAILEVRDGVLRYRRGLKWRTIPRDEIIDGRIEWPPALGSIRLKKYLFPWGRLYFALDTRSRLETFHRGEYPLLNYLCDRKVSMHEDEGLAKPFPLIAAAVTGAILYYLVRVAFDLVSQSGLPLPAAPEQPQFLGILFRIGNLLAAYQAQLVFSAIFVFAAVYRRHKRNAWVFALIAGFSLAWIFLHLLVGG
jgi:hypothetical protein